MDKENPLHQVARAILRKPRPSVTALEPQQSLPVGAMFGSQSVTAEGEIEDFLRRGYSATESDARVLAISRVRTQLLGRVSKILPPQEIDAISVASNSYELIVVDELLEFARQPLELLQKLHAGLVSGGRVLIVARYHQQLNHEEIARYSPQWWEAAMAEAGFRETRIQQFGSFFSVIGDMLRASPFGAHLPSLGSKSLAANSMYCSSYASGFGIEARK